jgi:hypothetical protein
MYTLYDKVVVLKEYTKKYERRKTGSMRVIKILKSIIMDYEIAILNMEIKEGKKYGKK